MSNYRFHFKNLNPLVIFSLGLILGASIVAMIFFYRLASPSQYESAYFKFKPQAVKNLNLQNSANPVNGITSIGGPEPTMGVNGRVPDASIGGPNPTRGL